MAKLLDLVGLRVTSLMAMLPLETTRTTLRIRGKQQTADATGCKIVTERCGVYGWHRIIEWPMRLAWENNY